MRPTAKRHSMLNKSDAVQQAIHCTKLRRTALYYTLYAMWTLERILQDSVKLRKKRRHPTIDLSFALGITLAGMNCQLMEALNSNQAFDVGLPIIK